MEAENVVVQDVKTLPPEPSENWRLVVLRGGKSWPAQFAVAGAVLLGMVALVQFCERAYTEKQMLGPLMVWICMGVAGAQLAWYLLLAKQELNNKAVWQGRDEAFTAFTVGGASVLLLTISFFTGGPSVTNYEFTWNQGFFLPVIACGLLNVGILLAKIKGKAREDLSLVAPIETSTPAIVIVFGIFFLGEMPGMYGWIGIWLLAIGTYTLSIKDLFEKLAARKASGTLAEIVGEERSGWRYWISVWLAPITSLRRSVGVRWAYLAVLLSLIALNYEALGARNANVAFAYGCVFGIAGLGNLFLALYYRQFSATADRPAFDWWYVLRAILLMAVLFAVIHLAFGLSYRVTLMAHVGALKRLAIPLTIIGAFVLLGERKKMAGRLVGGVIMTVGAILIALDM